MDPQPHHPLPPSPYLLPQRSGRTKMAAPPCFLNPHLIIPFPKPRAPTLRVRASSVASTSEIDMVRTKQGTYAAKDIKVVVLWDLDNKPPRGRPYQAATSLKSLAQSLGDVIEISAYANRHAFDHLPQWVREERRNRRELDALEKHGALAQPPGTYTCGVCGRKCGTHVELKKHFRQLHERERQKKVNRMNSLKGKKRQRFKERFISGNQKYNEEARRLVKPRQGYGLAEELKRAGVYVKTVADKPQAADLALKKQIRHSMSRGVDWLFLVSDDSDFKETLRRAQEASLGTVVVGDRNGVLGRSADVWVPWQGVEDGEVTEKDLIPNGRRGRGESYDDGDDYDDEDDDDKFGDMLDAVYGFDDEEGEDGDYYVWSEKFGFEDENEGFVI